MALIAPAAARSEVTSIPGGIRVEVSLRPRGLNLARDVGVAAVGVVWTVLIAATVMRPPELPGDRSGSLGAWFVGLVIALTVLSSGWVLFQLVGKETVDLTARTLRVRRSAFGFGRTKEYDAAHVRRVRAEGRPPVAWLGEPGRGSVAFDYGARTIRIVPWIEEAEAADVAARLEAHLRDARPIGWQPRST